MQSSARWFVTALLIGCASGSAPAPTARPPAGPPAGPPVAAAPGAAPPAAAPPADPSPPALRLPTGARPVRHAVELTIDPATEDFTGAITTELELTERTTTLWQHGDELVIDEATFVVGGERVAARAFYSGKFIGLVPARALAPGRATLIAKYRGKMHKNDGDGIYTAKEANDWYAFTQFEATDARQAFPCFDEPSYKVPWRIAVRTRKELVALSNTPVESERDEPGGMKLVSFAETRPLPSYLVAFAVGPFDAVDAGKTRGGAPIRIVVPRGRGKDTGNAARVTRSIVDLLEDYFGTPYPYAKLDMLAVPVFNGGAMENPGLITWRQELVLVKAEELTLGAQRGYAGTAAHEIAHQWFGDYVTMAWWDDVWLNESFASWMASKIVDQWKPAWEVPVGRSANKGQIMGQDSLDAARAIRQPITTANDIINAFDGITYGKGEAVLTMLERTIGPDVFQRGVRAYLAKHAWGNATYEDFVGAMSSAAGKDLHTLFDSFVRQSGVPAVSFELACDRGKPPTLRLGQRRYLPLGSRSDPRRTWHVPVCVRWSAGGATGRDCTVLDGETGELALSAQSCPAWVMPNADGIGYYRMRPQGDLLGRLLAVAGKLTLAERVTLIGDVNALVNAGEADKGVALDLVASLARDKSRHIVNASINLVAGIDELVPAKLRPNYVRFIRKVYQARARELGWRARPGEDDDAGQLRRTLLPLVANLGGDAALIKQGTELAWKWLDAHDAVDAEIAPIALEVASHNGDQKLFDRLHADAKKTTDRTIRARLLGAIGEFVEPTLVAQAMAIVLTDEFEVRESFGLLQGAASEPRTREQGYRFIKEHFDELTAKLPALYRAFVAMAFVPVCDDARKAEIEAFLAPRMEKFDGGPRVMAQALESLSLCAARRKAQAPGVEAFLKRQ